MNEQRLCDHFSHCPNGRRLTEIISELDSHLFSNSIDTMTLPVDLDCLWANPDQAGNLQKHSHKRMSGWQDRFFVLKVCSIALISLNT